MAAAVDAPPSVAVAADAAVDPPADEGAVVASWLVGLAGTTSLAVGLLAVYRRLHRQLVAAADLPLVRWAGQELSGVLFGLGRPVAGPVAVELSEATGLELLWGRPDARRPGTVGGDRQRVGVAAAV